MSHAKSDAHQEGMRNSFSGGESEHNTLLPLVHSHTAEEASAFHRRGLNETTEAELVLFATRPSVGVSGSRRLT